ncbi:MAG: hypothetical protein U0359_10865 [Byssovorax sp.]
MGKRRSNKSPNAEQLARLVPDQTEAEVEALNCALRTAPSFWLTQPTLQRLVTDTSRYIDTYARALHQIERRTVAGHTAPGPAHHHGPQHPLPDPSRLDPWSVDPATIEAASRVVSTCPTCHGSQTVACGRCDGSARVRCGNCWGSGRVQGKRSMKNCPVCRGDGKVTCDACTHGRVPCQPCGAAGVVWAWLSIAQTRMQQVRVHPMGAAALVHRKLKSPRDFDANPQEWVNELTSDTGTQDTIDALPAELEPELDPVTDRALSTRVQSFSSVVHRFTYEAARMTGHLEVAGVPPAVSKSSNWRPLRIRQGLAAATALGLGLASLMLMGTYAARHPWYETYGHRGWVGLMGGVMATALAVVVAGLLLPRRLWSRGRVWIPAGVAGAAALGFAILWKYPGPTLPGARNALAAKDMSRAQIEAEALRDLKLDWRGGSEVLDDLHLERLKTAETFDQLASMVSEPWNLEPRREAALRVLHDVAEQKQAELYAAKNLSGLLGVSKSIGELDAPLRDKIASSVLLLRAERCTADKDCSCLANNLKAAAAAEAIRDEVTRVHDEAVPAFAAALKDLVTAAQPAPMKDPHERQATLRQALQLAKCYTDLASTPSNPPLAALEKLLGDADREVDAADKKAAAVAALEEAKRKRQEAIEDAKRKQAEAAAAAKQAAEERAQRAANRSLLCNDGSISGCSCSGSHRGCCSHHGGVAGCEPL